METAQNITAGDGIPASLYKPLAEGDVKRVADQALELLEKSGVLVFSPTARSVLKEKGAFVDESSALVKLPKRLVEDAIDSNPSSITLYSRKKNDYHAVLEKNRVHFGTGGTAIYVLDPFTGKHRPSTIKDVIMNAQLAEALENIHVFTINVFPNEIKEKNSIDVNRFFHSLANTSKHVMGGVYTLEGSKKVVRMAEEIAGGEEALRREPFVSFITLIISPFKIDEIYGEMTCYFAEKGLPVVVPTEPVCGTTSPITLAGNVLTHIAETLAGIALVQSVRRGAPGICGNVGSITNLRTMDHVGGAVERAMISAAVAQLAQYFELPVYSTGGTTDSKEVDIQSAYESAMSSLLVAMSGANYIHDIAGLMESDLTVSYGKMVMDNEILGMCRRVMRGIEVNDDTLAADLIAEKKPGSDFLGEEHTIKYMREEFYMPTISNREKRTSDGLSKNALEKARGIAREVISGQPGGCLDQDVRKKLMRAFPEIKIAAE